MKDSLSYRISGESDEELRAAFETARDWIEANANGPVKLNFSIALRLAPDEDGATLATISKTEPLLYKRA